MWIGSRWKAGWVSLLCYGQVIMLTVDQGLGSPGH